MLLIIAIPLAIFVVPSPWGLPVVVAAVVVEVAETFFWIRLSRRGRVRAGPETLIGAQAEVVASCRPTGQVRLQGELWRAHCEAGADVGDVVLVRAFEGLTILVDRAA
ncbi:MAG: NfeD family protein [Candidatus Limnocylindria bacterium]